jgi:hypothetical protein
MPLPVKFISWFKIKFLSITIATLERAEGTDGVLLPCKKGSPCPPLQAAEKVEIKSKSSKTELLSIPDFHLKRYFYPGKSCHFSIK